MSSLVHCFTAPVVQDGTDTVMVVKGDKDRIIRAVSLIPNIRIKEVTSAGEKVRIVFPGPVDDVITLFRAIDEVYKGI